jgi:hypothetical protein
MGILKMSEKLSTSQAIKKIFLYMAFFAIPGCLVALAILCVLIAIVLPQLDGIVVPQPLYQDWLKMQPILKLHQFIPFVSLFFIIAMIIYVIAKVYLFFREQSRISSNKRTLVLKIILGFVISGCIATPLASLSGKVINEAILFYSGFGELTLASWIGIGLAFIIALSIPSSIGGMLVFGIPSLNLTKKGYLIGLVMILGLISIFIGGSLFFYNIATTKYDYNKRFWEDLNIPSHPLKKRTVIVLRQEDERPHLMNSPLSYEVTQFERSGLIKRPLSFQSPTFFEPTSDKVKISSSLADVEKTYNYLKEKNYQVWSYFGEMINYIVQGYSKNWCFFKMLEAQLELFQKKNYIIGGMALLAYLERVAQYDLRYLKIAERLADEENFHHGAKGSKLMGDIYLHFGKYTKACYWYAKAKREGYKSEKYPIPKVDPQRPFLKEGSIKGKILLDRRELQGIKVGLAWIRPETPTAEIKIDSIIPSIVAATTTDGEGRFYMNNLLEGEYYLVVMADEEILPPTSLHVDRMFGKLVVNKSTPNLNLGIIRISTK